MVPRYGPTLYWTRDDAAGTWNSTRDWPGPDDSPPCPPIEAAPSGGGEEIAQPAVPASSPADAPAPAAGSTAEFADSGDDLGEAYDEFMQRRMVQLEVDIPLVALADGVHSRCFTGTSVGSTGFRCKGSSAVHCLRPSCILSTDQNVWCGLRWLT